VAGGEEESIGALELSMGAAGRHRGGHRAVEVALPGQAAVGVGGGVDGGERVDVDVGGRRWEVEE